MGKACLHHRLVGLMIRKEWNIQRKQKKKDLGIGENKRERESGKRKKDETKFKSYRSLLE